VLEVFVTLVLTMKNQLTSMNRDSLATVRSANQWWTAK